MERKEKHTKKKKRKELQKMCTKNKHKAAYNNKNHMDDESSSFVDFLLPFFPHAAVLFS